MARRLAVPAAIAALLVALVVVVVLLAANGSGTRTAASQIGAFSAPAPHLRAADAALRDRFVRFSKARRTSGTTGTVDTDHARVFTAPGVAIAAAPTTSGDVCGLVRTSGREFCTQRLADGGGLVRDGRVISGLVPDGVTRLELRAHGGRAFVVAVRDNVFAFSVPRSADAIAGYTLVYADGRRVRERSGAAG